MEYKPHTIGSSGKLRYCCDCANCLRTIGCCLHIAAIIYYLSHGRYNGKTIRPAEFLNFIFGYEDTNPVINEDRILHIINMFRMLTTNLHAMLHLYRDEELMLIVNFSEFFQEREFVLNSGWWYRISGEV